jgi:UDP-glucose 4-epimerase
VRILVTGGCGYIGGHVVQQLLRRGHAVVVLDDLSTGHPSARGEAELVQADVRDAAVVQRLTRRSDAIIHLAAIKDVAASLADPGRVFAVNVEGSRVVLGAARAHGAQAIVFSSSCAVYGEPRVLPIPESEPLWPVNPYGESKAIVERMLPWFERAGGARWVSLRYANAAGADPEGHLGEAAAEPTNLVPRVMAVLGGRIPRIEVFGTDYPTPDGTAVRDFVHVVDLADAHVRAIEYLASGGASVACNLGTGRGASVRQVLELAGRIAGRPVPVVERPRRPGDPPEVRLASDLARQVLGWVPAYDLAEIIASAWRWHSAHPDGYGTRPSNKRS